MWQNAHNVYLESRILSADPLELVGLLYQACTSSVRDARRYLAEGDISGRCQSISKAHEILVELSSALDHERGGDLSRRLAELYDYIERKLLEGNFQQRDAPLTEVLGLLSTLSEAWDGIRKPAERMEPAQSAWSQPPPPEPTAASSAHGWTL